MKDVDGISEDVLKRAVKKKREQATNFIFDINRTPLEEEALLERLYDLMSDKRYNWLETAMLTNFKENEVIEILKRK